MSSIDLQLEDGIAIIMLKNERKLNALTTDMLSSLEGICSDLETDQSVRGVVVASEGNRAFCAGADIASWGTHTPSEFARDWIRYGHRVFNGLARLSKPTVAAIDGVALGGGLELAATCDIRVASPDAVFGLPEAQIGVVPGWSGTQRLARLIPEPMLKEMAIFGRRISAERAYGIGFVCAVEDDALRAAKELIRGLERNSPRSMELAKYMIHAGVGEARAAMIDAMAGAAITASEDKIEGVKAFNEKRIPRFSGE